MEAAAPPRSWRTARPAVVCYRALAPAWDWDSGDCLPTTTSVEEKNCWVEEERSLSAGWN